MSSLYDYKKKNKRLNKIIPDSAKGINTFNTSMTGLTEDETESKMKQKIEKLETRIISATINFMINIGYSDDEAQAYTHFEFKQEGAKYRVEVTANINSDDLNWLKDTLDMTIVRLDRNSEFEKTSKQTLTAYVSNMLDIKEQLKSFDKLAFEDYSEVFDLHEMYSMNESNLTAEDKSKLQKFLQTTDDPKEIDIYLKGLISEELIEDINTTDELAEPFNEIISMYDALKNAIVDLKIKNKETVKSYDIENECNVLLIDLEDIEKDRLVTLQEYINE